MSNAVEGFDQGRRQAGSMNAEPAAQTPAASAAAFVFMVFHWPKADHVEALAASMREMREALLSTPGCVQVDPPYMANHEGDCLVGVSKWESKAAFLSAGLPLRAPDEIVEGEARLRQRFLLEEIQSRPGFGPGGQ